MEYGVLVAIVKTVLVDNGMGESVSKPRYEEVRCDP